MNSELGNFLIHWAIMGFSLWVASYLFNGIKFSSKSALLVSALVLGFVNAILRPILLLLTFPLTLITLGLFALVINALMIMLVAKIVDGFKLSGFWTAFFASIFIALFGFFIEMMLPSQGISIIANPETVSI
ncbi:hypothetical protein A7981_05930 [Methylovorus sp. MM2]|uniref:phage holin family protein n=1 Tax=Methylovorus sp. MM2 TaxID=1848038 RepID=UPI0007DEC4AF|nr:phage holin family protein [Methylovorus sp. MM2]OAM52968.1 hypothetical protein A7981_05930 [Methylovorus sp. MM2]